MARTEQNVVENEQKAEEMNVNGIEAAKQDERTETVVSVAEAAFEKCLNGNDTEEATEKKTKAELPALYIYRRPYTNKSDGKKYWEYVLPAVFCGQVAEVGLIVRGDKDVAGYQMLEQLFDGGVKKVLFRAEEAERFDENTGKVTKYWTYSAVVEKDGFEWTFPLTTRRPSDRAILENYIRYLRFVAEREATAAQTGAKA